MFSLTDINLLQVLGAGVVYMIIGMLWYGPFFGKAWTKLKGLKDEDLSEAGPSFAYTFVASLIGLLLLAILHKALGITEAGDGISLGIIAGSIFAAYKFNDVVYDKPRRDGMRMKLWFLNIGYIIISLAIAGYIFTL